MIARVEEGPRKGEFLFTPQTVARLNDSTRKCKDLPYKSDTFISHDFLDFYISTPGRMLPPKWSQWLPAWSTGPYLAQAIWQWCALAVSLVFLALLFLTALYRRFRPRAATLSTARRTLGMGRVYPGGSMDARRPEVCPRSSTSISPDQSSHVLDATLAR